MKKDVGFDENREKKIDFPRGIVYNDFEESFSSQYVKKKSTE